MIKLYHLVFKVFPTSSVFPFLGPTPRQKLKLKEAAGLSVFQKPQMCLLDRDSTGETEILAWREGAQTGQKVGGTETRTPAIPHLSTVPCSGHLGVPGTEEGGMWTPGVGTKI